MDIITREVRLSNWKAVINNASPAQRDRRLCPGAASWLKPLFQENMRNSSCRHLLHNLLRCLLISAHCIPD